MKTKSKITKILSLLLCFCLFIGSSEAFAGKKTTTTVTAVQTKNIYVGRSIQLKLSSGVKAKKWITSNKKIATISSKGKIKALKAGKATITCITTKNKKQFYTVNVKNPYLNKRKATLTEKKTLQLTITGTTAKQWTSSNKTVATVSSKGKVTALKAGKAIITCSGNNKKNYKCTITVNTCKHKYVLQSYIKESCTKDGYKIYKCSACGKTLKKSVTRTNRHNFKLVSTVNSTCKEKGYSTYKCKRCGLEKKQNITDIVDHKFITSSSKQPTCTQDGYIIYKCEYCDLKKTETINKLYHSYHTISIVEPTCKEKGYTVSKCVNCGDIIVSNEDMDVVDHDFIEESWHEPTCTEKGYSVYKCRFCGITKQDDFVDMSSHEFEVKENVGPTCTQEGCITKVCKNCGKIEKETIPKIEHEYEIIGGTQATCQKEGSSIKKCKNCGKQITKILPTNDNHTNINKEYLSQPSDNSFGYYEIYCEDCGEIISSDNPIAPDYSNMDWDIDKEKKTVTIRKIKGTENSRTLYIHDEYEIEPHDYYKTILDLDYTDDTKIASIVSIENCIVKNINFKNNSSIDQLILEDCEFMDDISFEESFYNCPNLSHFSIISFESNPKTVSIKSFEKAFYNCPNLSSVSLYNISCDNLKYMCYNCEMLTEFDSSEDLRPKYLDYAFYNTDLNAIFSLDTQNVETMNYAFYNSQLGSLYLSCLDLKNCREAAHAFENVHTYKYIDFDTAMPLKNYGICLHNLKLEDIEYELNISEMLKNAVGFIYCNELSSTDWNKINEQGKVTYSDFEKNVVDTCHIMNQNLVHKNK